MYRPKQVGIPAEVRSNVVYREFDPPETLKKLYFCTWELRTAETLANDFLYLILPDVCTDIVFNLQATDPTNKAFSMTLGGGVQEVNLGKQFHYVGVRFLPGVLRTNTIKDELAAQQTWQHLQAARTTEDRQTLLVAFVESLLVHNKIAENYLMHQILSRADQLRTVNDLEKLSGYTRRQLQRIFREQTGLTPSEFLKVLRFQNTLEAGQTHPYADQSHLTKEYRRITGLTPRAFRARY